MRAGHLDCASGASGDMFLGALVDAGASIEAIQDAVHALGVGDVRITVGRVKRAGMAATSVRVRPPQDVPPPRTWVDIRSIIEDADLPDAIRDRAHAVFRRLAIAEGQVHGVAPEDIHFHEIGALDTLGDVVGAVAGLQDLGLERLTVGPIATGTGSTETMHGIVPIPVPATVELLQGFTLVGTDISAELVTPTGAALIAELATPVATMPAMTLERVGVGAGGRDNADRPNVLRLLVGDAANGPDVDAETTVHVLEATVDDLSPELIPVVLDHLRDGGAHDAWATPVLMKKGRPGFTLTALAPQVALPALRSILYRESSTIGTRSWPVHREALPREWVEVTVAGETIRVKVARHEGEVVSVAPEADDVRRAAESGSLPARRVHTEAEASARALLSETPASAE